MTPKPLSRDPYICIHDTNHEQQLVEGRGRLPGLGVGAASRRISVAACCGRDVAGGGEGSFLVLLQGSP